MLPHSLAIWFILIAAEILHGIARDIFLVSLVGEFRSNQIGVFTGSFFVVGASWQRLASDYNVLEGGLLPFGMIVLALSPWIAGKVRGVV
jgi:hypothetical protein